LLGETAKTNLWPAYRGGEDIVSVFAVFFPGMTGMMAGSAVIDELKVVKGNKGRNWGTSLQDPDRAVPLGMFAAIANCAVYYFIGLLISGATAIRDVPGTEIPLIGNWTQYSCIANSTCKYGLMNYFQVHSLNSSC
jgi:hypothetical protein